MTDPASPRFKLLGEPLRYKKVGVYDEIHYPADYPGAIKLVKEGRDTTRGEVRIGTNATELPLADVPWSSTDVEVGWALLPLLRVVDPVDEAGLQAKIKEMPSPAS